MHRISQIFFAIAAIATLFAAGSASAQCNPVAVEVNTTPAPPYRSSAMREHLAVMAKEPKRAPLMLIGDSQAQRWPQEKLDIVFGQGNTVNLGVAGDRIQNTLWRLGQIDPKQYDPKFVFLALGTNNQGDTEPGCAMALGLTKVEEKLAEYWPDAQIVMLKMMPRGGDGYNYQEKERVVAMKETKMLPQTTVLDVDQDITCGLMGVPTSIWFKLGSVFYPDQTRCQYIEPDALHLSNAGYDYVGNRLKALIPLGPSSQ